MERRLLGCGKAFALKLLGGEGGQKPHVSCGGVGHTWFLWCRAESKHRLKLPGGAMFLVHEIGEGVRGEPSLGPSVSRGEVNFCATGGALRLGC